MVRSTIVTPGIWSALARCSALAVACAGCAAAPANNSLQADPANVQVGGLVPESTDALGHPGAEIWMDQWDFNSSQWLWEQSIWASKTPSQTDAVGVNWYQWSEDMNFADGTPNSYAHASLAIHRITNKIRFYLPSATLENRGSPEGGHPSTFSTAEHDIPLTTFDDSADTNACIAKYEAQGGQAIMAKCASKQSPEITFSAECGAKVGEPCCKGACDSPYKCDYGGQCVTACGGNGQEPCPPPRLCNPGFTWKSGKCAPAPKTCSPQNIGCGSGCCSGLTCQNGACEPPPAAPPPPKTVTTSGLEDCTELYPQNGYAVFACSIGGSAANQAKLLSVTNGISNQSGPTWMLKPGAQVQKTCDVSGDSKDYLALPSGTAVPVNPPISLNGEADLGFCVKPPSGDPTQVSGFILTFGYSYVQQ